jgi:ribonuclease R
MPERYADAILKYLSGRDYQPLKPRQLARQMGVADAQYGAFREAIKRLRDVGHVVLGERHALTLPEMTSRVVGEFRANPRGFGFVTPATPNAHGDLFIPPEETGGAMSGDLVVARARKRGRRDGQTLYAGSIVEILRRGENRFVGTLTKAGRAWFVQPDGKQAHAPIVVRDIGAAGPKEGAKVVVEIAQYAQGGELATGVIVETLGRSGPTAVETQAIIRSYGIADEFSKAAMADARKVVKAFNADDPAERARREDLTDQIIVTIDPPDARDYDDAISLRAHGDGTVTLGVHIADVSHFVREGGDLDADARSRATSVYFPRRVVPMLPEILSNGVCSLQEGETRFCKSAFITYDANAKIVKTRLAETLVRSSARLTYLQAQAICDGQSDKHSRKVVKLVRAMAALAKKIEARRIKAGMLELDLPEAELVYDDKNRVVDVTPADNAYTHKVIEMFMVEANEAVAATFDRLKRPILRRIHPAPDELGGKQLSAFVRAAGHKLPRDLSRHDIQALLKGVRGRPESYAVNLAVLKMFQQAEYSPMPTGHFALAGKHYCHFTSPIRRYPDLTVHRMVAEHCRGKLASRPPEDVSELSALGEHCNVASRRAEAAERELRDLLVLQLLKKKVGETFDGVITGVTNFGIFVQLRRFLVEGLIRLEELGDDWWDVNARYGTIRGERTGKTYRIGDVMTVQIVGVDLAGRKLNVAPERKKKQGAEKQASSGARKKGTGRSKDGTKRETGKRGKGAQSVKTTKRSKSAKSAKGTTNAKGRRKKSASQGKKKRSSSRKRG